MIMKLRHIIILENGLVVEKVLIATPHKDNWNLQDKLQDNGKNILIG